MKPRLLSKKIRAAAKKYPILAITGPRQSGKTTLVKALFPEFEYQLLENKDVADLANEDPKGFLNRPGKGLIIDEAQRVPQLFSYLQGIVDDPNNKKTFVLSGSQNFILLESITQSLAGRVAIFNLLQFSMSELGEYEDDLKPWKGNGTQPVKVANLDELLFSGLFPRIHDKKLEPQEWLRNYYRTYIERDVRSITNVGDIEAFSRFITLCAGRCGQVLDLSKLGADAGVSQPTAKRWLSILSAGFQVFLLQPYYKNFRKRIVKSPKLYFFDTGLLCYLLRIRSAEDLFLHAARGSIFESFVISEFYKKLVHRNLDPDLYYWRDSNQNEIDLILDYDKEPIAVEIKSGQTIANDFFRGLKYWQSISGEKKGILFYGGRESTKFQDFKVLSWNQL